MSERVGANVAVVGGVGKLTNAHRVEHNEDALSHGALLQRFLFFSSIKRLA